MHLNISLDGTEPTAIVQKVVNALLAYMTGFPAQPEAAPAAAAPAPEASAEAPKVTKSQAKRVKVQQEAAEAVATEAAAPWTEPAETATADQSAVIAEAKAQLAAESQPAAEVKIEAIRAVAAKFNTDALRETAMGILRKHGAASVSALADRDNIIRVSALADFEAALAAV